MCSSDSYFMFEDGMCHCQYDGSASMYGESCSPWNIINRLNTTVWNLTEDLSMQSMELEDCTTRVSDLETSYSALDSMLNDCWNVQETCMEDFDSCQTDLMHVNEALGECETRFNEIEVELESCDESVAGLNELVDNLETQIENIETVKEQEITELRMLLGFADTLAEWSYTPWVPALCPVECGLDESMRTRQASCDWIDPTGKDGETPPEWYCELEKFPNVAKTCDATCPCFNCIENDTQVVDTSGDGCSDSCECVPNFCTVQQ
eukprot:UN29343